MTTLRAQAAYPHPPPPSLISPFQRNVYGTPPNKRRKVSGARSLPEVRGSSESGVPLGYIPLACFVLDLNFADPDPTNNRPSDLLSPPYSLPVILQKARLIRAGRPSGIQQQEYSDRDVFKFDLATTPMKEVIFTGMLTDSDSLGFRDNLELASHLVCADHCFKDNPTTCYKSTLHCSSGGRFCLETMVLWEDSLISPNFRRLMDPTHRVFSKYVLERERQSVSAHADRLCGWQERDLSARRTWSPRDFYNNVYVPPDTPDTSAEIKGDLIESRLYPFQRRAVRWLLEREGVRQLPDGRVVPNESLSSDQLPPSFEEMTDVYGRTFFFSPLYMVVTTDLGGWPDAERNVLGGILAEEMGLGKTVEMISLICLNRRPNLMDQTRRIDSHGLRFSGATLIITPPTILEQWKQEISLHAPALRVFHYSGFQSHKGLSEQDLIERMSDHDIVLTTYNVLAREVYHSGDAPKRNLRHAKRFEFRKTPLVLVSWWRVCLDEAQMIESGVSNAARVARLIPRQIAWAVTGTPIRKDISDLFGLLLFLDYQPFCKGDDVWARLCHSFHYILARMVNTITIRHNKDHVRSELDLPRQKRVVITIPFTAIEEQHYGQLYEQMCEECGLDTSGAPLAGDWNPDDPYTIDRMRNWLSRLRQTCLHPEVAGSNRRALGTGSGPLRSVDEVLEVMIDQNDTLIRAEERAFLLSQLRRGQMLENATRRREAFDLWKASLDRASEIVKECMHQLHLERTKIAADGFGRDTPAVDASDNEDGEKFSRLGTNRQRLRAALEVQHICQFFIGNAYYQIKSDPKLTEPDSEEFASLEESEGQAYEAAKLIRKEMLVDVSQKVGRLMEVLKDKGRKGRLVHIPRMKPHLYSMGLESRRVLEKLEDFCEAMNAHAAKYNEWRGIMAKLLTLSLIDQEEDAELEGNEYEKSTKHQDEMYVYMEALRTMFADRHDALTGQKNVLIAREVKGGILQAQKGEGPSPALFLSIMNTRSEIMPDPELGSLRGIISELRSLVTSLEWQASGGSSRARSELELVNSVFSNASQMAAEQGKAVSNLEREVEMFRNTMNSRLEYYRQLQQISDTVAPYDEESAGKPLDEEVYSSKCKQEGMIDGKIAGLKAKRRYLIHLRDESGSDDGSKICVVCQSSFEIGVLTVCGHKYCKDCLRIWWNQHRTCPTCKMRLRVNDFHQITYKPQEIVAQEETAPTKERASENLIYSDVSSGLLREIKDIDLDWSFGTKIDTLARHIMWLREHDPGAKAVVFSQYKSFLGVLGGAFSRFKIGHSSVDNKDGIESFKRDPAVECFLLHAKAHSSGLNLVNATHVFLCEPLINTAIELQAIARVHRIGQQRPTTVWMYLVSDTVEESIYNLSVSRRLAHILEKEKEVDLSAPRENGVPENLTEVAIDSANSMEIEDATLSRLMMGGASGGELVKKDDLWECLFGKPNREEVSGRSIAADGEVGRFLRGEAAEQRRGTTNS